MQPSPRATFKGSYSLLGDVARQYADETSEIARLLILLERIRLESDRREKGLIDDVKGQLDLLTPETVSPSQNSKAKCFTGV
jgi:hypothetical protein